MIDTDELEVKMIVGWGKKTYDIPGGRVMKASSKRQQVDLHHYVLSLTGFTVGLESMQMF